MKHSHSRLRAPVAPGVLVAALGALFVAVPVRPAAGQAIQTLDPVFVTATSRPEKILDVQASVQVVTPRDLEAFPGTSVTEALKLAVGVDARPYGANSSIAIRGFISGAGSPILVLVDGMRRPSKYGLTNLNLYELENVDRIEIVRGPMSALYGADAMGGVINIITRSPLADTGTSGNVRGLAGVTDDSQRDTYYGGGTVAFGTDSVRHRVSAEYRTREAFRYDKSAYLADLGDIDQVFATYDGAATIAPGHALRWTLEYLDQNDTSPGLLAAAPPTRPTPLQYEGYEKEKRWFGGLHYAGAAGPGLLDVDLSYSNSDGSTTRSFPNVETSEFRQGQLLARYTMDLGSNVLVAGAGAIRDDIDVSINSQAAVRTNAFAFVQDEWTFAPQWRVLGGLRYDSFTDFGSVVTPRVSIAYSPSPWMVRAGYGTGYRAPSVLEQYSTFLRGRFLIVGDPDLQPEETKSWEIAASWSSAAISAEVIYFDNEVTNLIQTVSRPRESGDPAQVQSRSQYANVANATLRGVETNATWRFAPDWALYGAWEYLSAVDTDTGARLTQRARQVWRGSLRYESGPWRADLLARYYVDFYNSNPLVRGSPAYNTDYGTTDIKFDYLPAPGWTLSAGVQNIFDRAQPVNWNSTGAVMDPPARFIYGNVRYAF